MAKKLSIFFLTFFLSNCAFYYHDNDSGTDHIWGFGHLAYKVSEPTEKKQAVIRQVTLAGFGLGVEEENFEISAGWHQRERIHIYDENTLISIQKPEDGNFFLYKFGNDPYLNQPLSNTIKKGITP